MTAHGSARFPLLFDGERADGQDGVRCRQQCTGTPVPGAAHQDAAACSPQNRNHGLAELAADARRLSGASVALRILAEGQRPRRWLWFARHRSEMPLVTAGTLRSIRPCPVVARKVSHWLRGKVGPAQYGLVGWVFLRLLALIYLAAFASLGSQITGLVGARGILPLSDYLLRTHQASGMAAYWRLPTLFWLDSSDQALETVCWGGMASAAALFFGIVPRTALVLCYGLYLSLFCAGQTFTEYQWDLFLLESGFLAIFLPFGSRIVIWLYRWLVFRFMFMGGVVKIASGDPSWRNLNALRYHLETQPLPSPLAWHAYQWPDWILQIATGSVLVIELLVPWFVWLPRKPRLIAAAAFLLLQGAILLTGNYNFFNLLTIALCVFLLEDRDLRPGVGSLIAARVERRARRPSTAATASAALFAIVNFSVCAALLWGSHTHQRLPEPLHALVQGSAAFGVVNGYGPFAVISTERPEIIIEGSADGEFWQPYEFRYKPGALNKPLQWNIPHQPRADWQMWFAAIGDTRTAGWFPQFMDRLAAGSPPVVALLQHNPFPDRPPRYLRADFYRYRFASPERRAATGQTWQRERIGRFDPLPEHAPPRRHRCSEDSRPGS